MGVSMTIAQFLADRQIPYQSHVHRATATAMTSADAAHLPGDLVAKGVLCRDGCGYILAVIPASYVLEMDALSDCFSAPVDLASELEVDNVFPDCAPGAVPAVGQPYGLRVVWEDQLTLRDEVYLEGGDHETLLGVRGEGIDALTTGCDHGRISHHFGR